MKRRHFLLGASAGFSTVAAATVAPLWADFGRALYLTAANKPDNSTWLVGLTPDGQIPFALPIPARGHAAAVHPVRAEAVAFARRPGRFAVVLNCADGSEIARLDAPDGMHFYGHGAFSPDGRYLLTTENAYGRDDIDPASDASGRIGVWDARAGYQRLGDLPSGGVGPHEIIALPEGGFAVANGGIQTHPDFARAKLNLPDMRTNLARLDAEGHLLSTTALPEAMRQNSVRHIDVDSTGRVVAALQWQGSKTRVVPLVARFAPDQAPELLDHPATARLKHYAGSIAVSASGREIGVTGPKGGHVLFLDRNGAATTDVDLAVAAGVAQTDDGLLLTCAGGIALRRAGETSFIPVAGGWTWDNHLVRVG